MRSLAAHLWHHPPSLPRWVPRLIPLVGGALALLVLLVWLAVAHANMVTLPAASRHDAICLALGAEERCTTTEVAHLKGLLILTATTDSGGAWVTAATLVARRHVVATLLSPFTLDQLTARLTDPRTNWQQLVAPSASWPALRTLAGVPDGATVPVLQSATPLRTVGLLRVRLALVRLSGVP